uniref:SFRICE_029171 n=1 Tax=Spodoptera frugiperda TaxID=7108 RepID=A0A2H1WLQ8_SPOFR
MERDKLHYFPYVYTVLINTLIIIEFVTEFYGSSSPGKGIMHRKLL